MTGSNDERSEQTEILPSYCRVMNTEEFLQGVKNLIEDSRRYTEEPVHALEGRREESSQCHDPEKLSLLGAINRQFFMEAEEENCDAMLLVRDDAVFLIVCALEPREFEYSPLEGVYCSLSRHVFKQRDVSGKSLLPHKEAIELLDKAIHLSRIKDRKSFLIPEWETKDIMRNGREIS